MELSQQLLAVGLVLGLLFLAIAAAHRRGFLRVNLPLAQRPSRTMAVLERQILTPQHQLHLIRFGDRMLLIATHPHGVEVMESRTSSARAGAKS